VSAAGPFLYALMVVYALTGAACAVAAAVAGRVPARFDLALMVVLWPLYGPFLLAQPAAPAGLAQTRERDLARALRRVAGTPLARLLPDRAAVRALGRSVRAAALRVGEIDELLARPGMTPELAPQLQALRERFARRLAEVDALLARLLTQVEVLRLVGPAEAPGEELVGELVTRVAALGELLDEGRPARPSAPPG
jgi:hypothetical protein